MHYDFPEDCHFDGIAAEDLGWEDLAMLSDRILESSWRGVFQNFYFFVDPLLISRSFFCFRIPFQTS